MKLAVADLTIGQDIACNLFDITEQLACAEERLKLFASNDSIFRAASYLFAWVLRYLVKADFYLRTSIKSARAVKAASGGSVKFKKMFGEIQRQAFWLDREFLTAVETRQYYHLYKALCQALGDIPAS